MRSKYPKNSKECESRHLRKNAAMLKGNLTFKTKLSNRISTSSSLLPITPKEGV